jgi:hypothetical protein
LATAKETSGCASHTCLGRALQPFLNLEDLRTQGVGLAADAGARQPDRLGNSGSEWLGAQRRPDRRREYRPAELADSCSSRDIGGPAAVVQQPYRHVNGDTRNGPRLLNQPDDRGCELRLTTPVVQHDPQPPAAAAINAKDSHAIILPATHRPAPSSAA